LPWPLARRDRSCWLGSIGVLMNLLVAGCRAGRILVFAYPAGLGLPLSFRFSVRPTLSASARYRARRSGSVEPPVLRMRFRIACTRQADRSTASLEVCFPSAFAGRAALSEAAKPSDHPASTLRLAIQTPPEVGLSGTSAIPAVFPPCVHRAPGPRRAI